MTTTLVHKFCPGRFDDLLCTIPGLFRGFAVLCGALGQRWCTMVRFLCRGWPNEVRGLVFRGKRGNDLCTLHKESSRPKESPVQEMVAAPEMVHVHRDEECGPLRLEEMCTWMMRPCARLVALVVGWEVHLDSFLHRSFCTGPLSTGQDLCTGPEGCTLYSLCTGIRAPAPEEYLAPASLVHLDEELCTWWVGRCGWWESSCTGPRIAPLQGTLWCTLFIPFGAAMESLWLSYLVRPGGGRPRGAASWCIHGAGKE